MAIQEIQMFDLARIPDVTDEVSFHADALYVWTHLAEEVLPKFQANLVFLAGALGGDTGTILSSLAQLQALKGNASALNAGTVPAARLSGTYNISITGNAVSANSAGNADTVDGKHAGDFAWMNHWNSGNLHVTNGRLYVRDNDAGTESSITMYDDESPNGVKHIYANSNRIGFVGGDGTWKLYVSESGYVWAEALGWINERFADSGAHCQHNHAPVEFGSIDVGYAANTVDCPNPWVMVGMRSQAGSNVTFIRGTYLRNN